MKKSLRSSLQKLITERGYVSTDQIETYCKEHRYRTSNAERRLRESESPMIEAVKEKGYIVGYKPKRNPRVEHINSLPAFPPKKEERREVGLF